MLGAALAALDLSALLRLAFACLLFIAGWIFLTKKNVPCPKALNADFEGKEKFQDRQHMPIGSGGSDTVGVGVSGCPVCAQSASKKCSRCKSVWYCSQECQSKHWKAEHKSKCREMGPADNFDARGTGARRKSSAISLVPGHGTRKVLQEPKKILFPYDEFVKLFDWDKQGFPPCGLLNCGNSCFANVVLQCLACTRPLVAYLLEKDHSRGCLRRRDDWCFLCELQVHIKRASESSQSFSPINILSRLPNIGGNLGYGRQEDAHEFMRFAIDTMQSICLDEFGGEKAVDPSTQETTIVQYIFGGHLRSQVLSNIAYGFLLLTPDLDDSVAPSLNTPQVICTNCDVVSNRYENMMDLTVEIHGDSESLEECLDQFTIKEWLDGENMYKCDGCNDYVKAWKRLTVHQPPNVLTIALKRFQSGRFGKLNKRVTFPEILDLTPYMSGSGDGTDHYTLYGVIVHLDMLNASFFGHYICYTKDYRGIWYKIDDCKVIKVEVEEVLAQGAYMLLYHRINPRKDPFVKPVEPTTNTHLAETVPEISKTRAITESPTHDIISMDAEPQQNILLSETPSDFSTLRDTGHDRHLAECSSGNESEDMDPNAPAAEMTNPTLKFVANGANGIKLENSNFLENASSIEPLPSSKASNPANFSSAEAECEELLSYSNATLLMEEGNESVDVEVTSELSSKDEDVVMAEASTAPIPSSSSEPAAINCDFSIDDSGKKMKPIFSRGFLNKPVHKNPTGCEKAVQSENQGASSSSEANGYSNGHLKFQWDVEMANGNVDDGIISPDPNITPISSSRSNGRPRHHPKAESNGISSFHYNEIKEFGHEPPCLNFETSADIRNSACNGDGFGFELGEALSSSSFLDESRRLNQTNGFSIADFSD